MNLEKFEEWLKINCDSDNTTKTYFSQLRSFVNEYQEINQDTLNKKFINLKENKSKQTFNLFVNALKKYCEFSNINYEIPKLRKPDKRINQYITYKELKEEVLKYCPTLFENNEKKEFILKFMFFTGLRREELITLRIENIDLDNLDIKVVNTKGKKDRLVPITKSFSKQIKDYLQSHDNEYALDISVGELNYMFRILNENLGFRLKFNQKLFRHSCAVYWLDKGLSLPDVKEILGHKDIKTTMIYAEPNYKSVKEKFERITR